MELCVAPARPATTAATAGSIGGARGLRPVVPNLAGAKTHVAWKERPAKTAATVLVGSGVGLATTATEKWQERGCWRGYFFRNKASVGRTHSAVRSSADFG